MKYHISTQEKKNDAIRQMLNLPTDGSHTVEVKKIAQQRTGKQNRTLWKWLSDIADEFNNRGQTINIGQLELSIMWNKDRVCDNLLRPILKAMTGKDTTRTTVDNLSICIDYMREALENMGYVVIVPSKEQLENGK